MSTEPCVSHKIIVLDASRQRILNEFFVPSSASKTRQMKPSATVGSIGKHTRKYEAQITSMKHSRLKFNPPLDANRNIH